MCCGIKNITSPNRKAEKKIGPCKVCQLIDGDNSFKNVEFCYLCGQWICESCMPKIGKRGWAAIINTIKK